MWVAAAVYCSIMGGGCITLSDKLGPYDTEIKCLRRAVELSNNSGLLMAQKNMALVALSCQVGGIDT